MITAVHLAWTNTRRVKRALFGRFEGAVSKDVVSRAWRKVKVDRDAGRARSLADEVIVRLILDGTVIKTRLDRKATNISVLAAIGLRRDGQKVPLSIMNMGGESAAAWRRLRDELDARGLKRPELVIVDGALGLEAALKALHSPQAPKPSGARAQAHARRADRGLKGHDLSPHRGRDRDAAQEDRTDAALGAARFRPDPDAKGRRPGNPLSAHRTDAS